MWLHFAEQLLRCCVSFCPPFTQPSPHGVIQVKHSHFGPKNVDVLFSSCIGTFINIQSQCQFTKPIYNSFGCSSRGKMMPTRAHMDTHTHGQMSTKYKYGQSGVWLASCVHVKGNHWQERTYMAPPPENQHANHTCPWGIHFRKKNILILTHSKVPFRQGQTYLTPSQGHILQQLTSLGGLWVAKMSNRKSKRWGVIEMVVKINNNSKDKVGFRLTYRYITTEK